jgi:hypothetical protein
MTPALAKTAAATTGLVRPQVKLYAPQLKEDVAVYAKRIYLDPNIYIEDFRAPLVFDVSRASWAQPITISQIIPRTSGGHVSQRLRSWTLDGWTGLRRFFRLSVRNSAGKVIASKVMPFCPDGYPQRATPSSPATSPYPESCRFSTPFQIGNVWGLQKGWATDPMTGYYYPGVNFTAPLRAGKNYVATMTILPAWRAELHIPLKDATQSVHLHALKPSQCVECIYGTAAARHRTKAAARPAGPSAAVLHAKLLTNPPRSVLPDLVPLPSWGISVQNLKATKSAKASSQISFGATVAVLGNGPLDVEGFSSNHSTTMQAYQYFWRGRHLLGRARAGHMYFDTEHGHYHWHFAQFAQYRLLSASKKQVLRSHKVGFCIAPTDGVDLLLPHAVMQPSYTGFTGNCGFPGSLWVSEEMPVGWADTYFQTVAGQSFDITNLRNGTYYIEIIANPEHVLRETNTANDVSLRKIIIEGTAGHRYVFVPALHGIDKEH